MYRTAVIIGSTREGRQSQKAALYINKILKDHGNIESSLVDLQDYDIPMFQKHLKFQDDPDGRLKEFADIFESSDSIIIVSPEYNGGYPAVVKNALDHITAEIKDKPVGLVTTSSGGFGGASVLTQLRVVLLHMGALPVPPKLQVSYVQDTFGDNGELLDDSYEKKTKTFIDGFLWYTEAITEHREKTAKNPGNP
jgi:NAD(P)H-dependent FMN reductase